MAEAIDGSASGSVAKTPVPPPLRDPRFRVLLASFVFSQLPVHTMTFVLMTRLFEMTGTPLATSAMWLAYALPSVILGPIAGAVVDVHDRKHVLMVINLVRSAAVLVLALSGVMSPTLIYATVLFTSALNLFYAPAEIACLPSLVPVEGLPGATSLLFITQQAAVFVGFSLGGGLVAVLGVPGTLGLSAAMIFVAFIFVLFLPSLRACPAPAAGGPESLRARVSEGYRFLARQRAVLGPFLLLLSGQAILSVLVVSVPAVAAELIRIPVRAAGLAVVAPFAAGALAGAVQVPRHLARNGSARRVLETSLLLIGACLGLFIFVVPAIPGWLRVGSGAALSMVFGFAIIGLIVPSRTQVQARTPGGLQGRIFGSLSVLANIVSVVPVIFSGAFAHLFGVRLPLGLLGFLCLAGLALSRRDRKVLRGRVTAVGAC
jgi:MFS family permease